MKKNKKVKISIIVAILTSVIGASVVTGGGIVTLKITEDRSVWLTKKQYKEVKVELFDKYSNEEALQWDELQLLAAVLNKEAKEGKFKDIKEITLQNSVLKMIDRAMKEK